MLTTLNSLRVTWTTQLALVSSDSCHFKSKTCRVQLPLVQTLTVLRIRVHMTCQGTKNKRAQVWGIMMCENNDGCKNFSDDFEVSMITCHSRSENSEGELYTNDTTKSYSGCKPYDCCEASVKPWLWPEVHWEMWGRFVRSLFLKSSPKRSA